MYLIGQCGVGKTSLKRSLLGEEINKQEPSTVGIEFDVVEVKDSDKSKAWSRSADKQFMASEEYCNNIIVKETVRRKANREKQPYNCVESETVSTIQSKEATYEQKDGNGFDGRQIEEAAQRGKESSEIIDSEDKDSGKNKTDSEKGAMEQKTEKFYEGEMVLSDEMKRKIKEAWKNIHDYDDDAMDIIRFLFGDVGGQSVYYDVHSILLRQRSLFLLVVDLEKPLNDKAQLTFVDSETMKEVTLGNPLEETNLDYAKKWIAALRDLSPRGKKNQETSTQSTHQPKVIVVFTKPDKLSHDEVKLRKKNFYEVLVQSFKDIDCEFLIVANYTIKNTTPRNEEETSELESLRNKIFETAQEILKDQETTPINWLVLERTLATWMKAEDRRYIAFDDAQKLAEQCNVKDTFCEAMKFFHEENIVVHFHEKEPLRDLVVLDTAWLVELLTQVITVRPDRNCGGEAEAAWNELTEKGELNFARLPNALKELKQQEAWKEMMVRAGLISHWKGEIYFVPSMVTTVRAKQQIKKVLDICVQPSLYIDFNGDCIPLGFFTRLQVEFIKWIRGHEECGSKTPKLHCNFSCFRKEENGDLYTVYLIRGISRIQVAIRDIYIPEDKLGVFAKTVLSFLRDAINNISQNRPSFKSTRVRLGLKCDLCCEESEKCERHQKEACTDDDCVCILDLPSLQKGNVVCEKNVCGKIKTELTETFWVQVAAELDEVKKQPDRKTEMESKIRNEFHTEPALSCELLVLDDREIARIADRMPSTWQRVAFATGIFESHEVENILRSRIYEDQSDKARAMLLRYRDKQGTTEDLVRAIHEADDLELARRVQSRYFIDNAK